MFHDIIAAIFGGGATGLFGSIINSVGDYFKMREKYRHDEAIARLDMQTVKLEANRDIAVAKQTAMAKIEAAGALVQTKSYTADQRSYIPDAVLTSAGPGISWLMAIVDFIRGLVRPMLTMLLVVITWRIYLNTSAVLSAVKGGLDAKMALELTRTVILGILYLAFTAVGWWFGSRSKFDKIIKL